MRNDSFSIKFYLAVDKKTLNGEIPIYLRLTVNRLKAELCTRQHIKNAVEWDPITQRILKAKSDVNSILNTIEADLKNNYDELRYNKKEISALIIKNIYLGREIVTPYLIDYINKTFETEIKGNRELAETTVKNYKSTISHLNSFLEVSKQKKITLKQIDEIFIKKLDTFLLNTPIHSDPNRTLRRNTINKYHIKFNTLLNKAVEAGILFKTPYSNFKLKNEPGTRTFLTLPELTLIEEHTLGRDASLLKVRDVFMFSVYTGLRFADAINLKNENIEFDGKKFWILYRQKKTKEYNRIPVLKRAKDIYDKYLLERTVSGYILPRITNQKVNVYLKVIAELVGIKKQLTHHVARHTNATTIMLSNGVPLEVVSKQLGHNSLKTTQIYAKITNNLLSKAADKIDEILK